MTAVPILQPAMREHEATRIEDFQHCSTIRALELATSRTRAQLVIAKF
jgi:hypothetical protein